ncbi:MAG: flagellar export protein FliJ [Lautropia sp.]|nr:flagellar export protein FliJ [Lautropia sp.]
MKQALDLAIENYKRLRDEAAAELQQAQQHLSAMRNTLQTLDDYRAEQRQRRRLSADSSRRVAALRMDTHFAGTIEQAIEQQRLYVQQAIDRVEQRRMDLLGKQKKLKAVEMIVHQRAQRAAAWAKRQERLATDELAAIRHLQRIQASDSDS